VTKSKLPEIILLNVAIIVEGNLIGYISTADHYDDRTVPEQPDGYVFNTGATSASATAGVILTFPVINEAEAPALEVKPRPAFIKKA
jgi:hypothetical protein